MGSYCISVRRRAATSTGRKPGDRRNVSRFCGRALPRWGEMPEYARTLPTLPTIHTKHSAAHNAASFRPDVRWCGSNLGNTRETGKRSVCPRVSPGFTRVSHPEFVSQIAHAVDNRGADGRDLV